MTLKLADGLSLPVEATIQTFLVVGKRGSGKSTTCVRMAEQIYKAGVPVVVIDPADNWFGLKASRDGKSPGLSIYIFGGRHADLPLESTAGTLMANVILEHRISAVLSVKHFSIRERGRFVADFCQRLFQANREPLHLFLEEAHEVCPQNPMKGEEEMLGHVARIWKLGRSSGIGGSAITQRPASLSKNITTQAEILIVHRTLGPQDVAAVREWIRYHGEREDILGQLSGLQTGEAFIWAPDFPEAKPIGLKRVRIFDRETFDSSATPKVGQRLTEPRVLAPVDLEQLSQRMVATIQKAQAEDPRLLRQALQRSKARIRELEATMARLEAALAATQSDVRTVGPEGRTDPAPSARPTWDTSRRGPMGKGAPEVCLSADTEILSARGWLTYEQIKEGEVCAAYDPVTDQCRWEPVERVLVREYAGDMVRLKTTSLDVLITPDHRVVMRSYKQRTPSWKITPADRLPLNVAIPACRPIGSAHRRRDLVLFRILGWILTDGAVYTRNRRGRTALTLSQSFRTTKGPMPVSADMLRILQTFGVTPRRVKEDRGGGYNWYFPVGLSERFLNLLDGPMALKVERRIPRKIFETAGRAELYALYRGLCEGDGSWRRGHWCTFVGGASRGFADDFQELATRLGISSTLRERQPGLPSVIRGELVQPQRHTWRVLLRQKANHCLRRAQREHYSGLVWDVTIPSGAFVARRHGHVFITGNCPQQSQRLPKGAWRMLAVLADRGSLTQKQILIRAGLRSSGTSGGYLRCLLEADLVSRGHDGLYMVSQRALQTYGPFPTLPKGRDLLAHWLTTLRGGAGRILSILADHYPAWMERQTVLEKAGLRESGTSLGYLALLANLDLVERHEARIRMSAELSDSPPP